MQARSVKLFMQFHSQTQVHSASKRYNTLKQSKKALKEMIFKLQMIRLFQLTTGYLLRGK